MIPIDSTAGSARYQKHCPGCFQLKGGLAVCPHCGYDESQPRSPLFLPHGMILGGQYRVGRVLGRPGGFGITYLGWDINLQQRVAIKEYLPRELAARTQDNLEVQAHTPEDRRGFEFGKEQFLREARIVAKLDHANIVRVRNFFNAHSTAYLVMDYYEGMSLGDYLSTVRTRLEPELAIPLMRPILDGLQYVHERGLVHRDLKPHNIYLAAVGRPIVLDFGAARQAAGDRVQSLSVVLTEGYAPLEQYQRRAIQGPWTDVYGAAATLFRMLTGHAPPIALDRIGSDPVEGAGWSGVPDSLVPAMRKALAVRPNERYQTAAEFRAALDQYRPSGEPVSGSRAATAERPASPDRNSASRPRSNTLPPMPPRAETRPPVPTAPISSRVPTAPQPERSPAPVVVLRAVPPEPVAPLPPSPPADRARAAESEREAPRPAGGFPLLGQRLSPTAESPSLPPPPAATAPRYRRASDPLVAPEAEALAFTPRRRVADRPQSRLPARTALVALTLVAALAVGYVLVNPPGEPARPAPSPVTTPAAAPPPVAVPEPTTGFEMPAPALAAAAPAELPQPPTVVGLPAGELRRAGAAPLALPAFRIGVNEVTVGEFAEFVRRSGYRNPRWPNYPCESAGGRLPEWDAPGYLQTDAFPVVCVSWADANAYVQWLSRETGLRFRLPTEAEWEFAARAGSDSRYWWGNDFDGSMAACQSCPPKVPTQPSPVRSYPANPFGLFEALGNVREWTCSPWQPAVPAERCGTPDQDARVAVRGGSWRQPMAALESEAREAFEPYRRNVWTGFRVVQELPGS